MSCCFSSLNQNVSDKGQDPKVSSNNQTLGSYLSRNVLANNWPHLHTFIDLCATANGLTACSGQVNQFLTKFVPFSIKNSWIFCLPRGYTQNVKQGHTFSAHIKNTIQCLTMAPLILFGVLHINTNQDTHFTFQSTQFQLLNKLHNGTHTSFTGLMLQVP